MPVFEVEVTESSTATLYVQADSPDAAEKAVRDFTYDYDTETVNTEVAVTRELPVDEALTRSDEIYSEV